MMNFGFSVGNNKSASVTFSDFFNKLKEEETSKEESTQKNEEEDKTSVFKEIGGNGQTEKTQNIADIEAAIKELDSVSFGDHDGVSFNDKMAQKAELTNRLEVAKLDDEKKQNRIYDLINDKLKYDNDLKIGIEYSIKSIEDEAVKNKLLKEIALIKTSDKNNDKENLEQKLDLVS